MNYHKKTLDNSPNQSTFRELQYCSYHFRKDSIWISNYKQETEHKYFKAEKIANLESKVEKLHKSCENLKNIIGSLENQGDNLMELE